MTSLFPRDKIDAVLRFLGRVFPGAETDVAHDPNHAGPRFTVKNGGDEHILVIKRGYLDEYSVPDLEANLGCDGADEKLKANPGRVCVVDQGEIHCS